MMNPSAIGIISSQLGRGATPAARANAITGTKFMPRLNVAVSDTDSGTVMRGKRTLRSSASRLTRHWTQLPVASEKKFQNTIEVSRYTP